MQCKKQTEINKKRLVIVVYKTAGNKLFNPLTISHDPKTYQGYFYQGIAGTCPGPCCF